MSDSESKALDKLPVKQLVGEMGVVGDNVDASAILDKFVTVDDNITVKSRIKNPEDLAIKDAYVERLKRIGMTGTAMDMAKVLRKYRENKCSEDGWLTEQVMGALKSVYPANMMNMEDENVSRRSRFLGGGRR